MPLWRPRLPSVVRPFFLGLILRRFATAALWLSIDVITGAQGHGLYRV